MIEDKRLKEIEKNVPMMKNQGEFSVEDKNKQFTKFYLENAILSLNTAKILLELSKNNNLKKNFKFISDDFESHLWVINTSYYSMFYIAGALLTKSGIKIKSEIGIHKKTFEIFVYYFYITKKIEKKYLEDFEKAQKESQKFLGTEEIMLTKKKAEELILCYNYEMDKRARFTYNMGDKAKENKADTSLKRAIEFYNECLEIMENIK